MKLILKRDQKAQTGLFGGHKGMSFILSYRVELSPEEQALIKKYKVENYPLAYVTRNGEQTPSDTVSGLLAGKTEELRDITVMLGNEETIKGACKNFRVLLDAMATFGGEEVLEF